MAAPDKIYITEYNANVETGYFSRNKDDVFTQEYIRKDALIEWLEKKKTQCLTESVAQAYFQMFIDKIESL